MKKKVVFIGIIIIVILTLFSSTSASTEEKIDTDLQSSKESIEKQEELTVSIKLTQEVANKVNVYKATIEYDKSILEELKETDFYCQSTWSDLKYNQENNQIILINTQESKEKEEIVQVRFKVKEKVAETDTIIALKNVTTSYGNYTIKLNDKEIEIKVRSSESQTENTTKDTNNNNPKHENQNINKIENNKQDENKNSNQEENMANTPLPQAGVVSVIKYVLLGASIITVIIFIRYKKIVKKMMIMILVVNILTIPIVEIESLATTEMGNLALKYDFNKDEKIDKKDIFVLEEYLIGLRDIEQQETLDMNLDRMVDITDLSIFINLVFHPDTSEEPTQKPEENPEEEKEFTVSDTSFKGYTFNQIIPDNRKVVYDRVQMTTDSMLEYGTNGAGSQWPVSLESSANGELMLYGTDVAGMFKSTDHGRTWGTANSGIVSRGVGMFAIDPQNANHVLTLGINVRDSIGGIHVSYDKAQTWTKTQSFSVYGARYLWDGLEFDPTSYDKEKNYTMDVYFSTPYKRDTGIRMSLEQEPQTASQLTEGQVGLYQSNDGGETFQLIINDKRLADGIIKVTENGNLYIGNQYGLFYIDKQNFSIKETYLENNPDIDYTKGITGMDVVDNTLYVQTWDGIYTLIDEKLEMITNENYPTKLWPQFLKVSNSNPNHMTFQYRSSVNNYYVNQTAVTFDGGKTWQDAKAELNSTFYQSNWIGREKVYIIDPSDDKNVITFGSDTLMRSQDGGNNFIQVSGISNMMQGGRFNFNYYDKDLLLFSAQDYTGVISTNGGKTYTRITIPGKGNFYGGFASDEDTIWGFASEKWGGGTLTYTHDGGDTWTDTGLTVSGVPDSTHYSSLQSIKNPNVLFAAEYYSKDRGYTWNKMNGCVSVFTYNYTGDKELYGGDEQGNLVVSYDNGDTWQKLSNGHWNKSSSVSKECILDLAYDWVNNYMYVLVRVTHSTGTAEQVFKYDINKKISEKLSTPIDTTGFMRIKSIAIDPNATSVIYVGAAGDYFSTATGLSRSIDGGKTWSVLTSSNSTQFLSMANNQGGYEVSCIRVDPSTGKLWIACGCYGYEIIDPPYDSSLLQHKSFEKHTIKYIYNNQLVKEVVYNNNEKHNYYYDEDGLTFVDWYQDKECTIPFSNGSRVYNSMVLYAKMRESEKIQFYDGENLLRQIDLDQYDPSDEKQIPIREGYVFAGWFLDKNVTQKVDFKNINISTSVYAGWYKIVESVFNIENKDAECYISYADHKIQEVNFIDNDTKANNRCIYMDIDENSIYFITFKMDTRFRMGMTRNKFYKYNVVPNYYINEEDNNGRVSANKYVYKTISTGNNNKLLIYYYTNTGTKEYMDIKKTFKIYKIESNEIYQFAKDVS